MPGNLFNKTIPGLAFKNAKGLSIIFYELTYPNNGFFVDDSIDYQAEVLQVKFVDCLFDELNTSILSPRLFKSVKELVISSELHSIQDELFLYLNHVEALTFDLDNFGEFITRSDNSWMRHLNSKKELLIILFMTLIDRSYQYEFDDKDFCNFKNFPTQNFVLSIVYSKEHLGNFKILLKTLYFIL